MYFTDYCILSDDVVKVAKFYTELFQVNTELNNIHTSIQGPNIAITVYNIDKAREEGYDFNEAGSGKTYIGFNVDNVNKEYIRVKALGAKILSPPVTWPWGATSFRFCDPDDNMIVFRSWNGEFNE